jgi:RNase P/RNase MRP subunit p29
LVDVAQLQAGLRIHVVAVSGESFIGFDGRPVDEA